MQGMSVQVGSDLAETPPNRQVVTDASGPSEPSVRSCGRSNSHAGPSASPGADAGPQGVAAVPPVTVTGRALTSPSSRAAARETGRSKHATGSPDWITRPASISTSRSAIIRASAASWVTISTAAPSARKAAVRSSRTPAFRWASSPENGSSSRIAAGSRTRLRARATRCCSPPDKACGQSFARSASPTRASAAIALSRRSARGRALSPNRTLSSTVRWGNSA